MAKVPDFQQCYQEKQLAKVHCHQNINYFRICSCKDQITTQISSHHTLDIFENSL